VQRARQPANRHHRKEKRGATGAPLFAAVPAVPGKKPHDEKFARRGYLKRHDSLTAFHPLIVPSTRIIREYTPEYPNPLSVFAGESVSVGREDDEFPGWKWCRAANGSEGWIPVELLSDASATETAVL
jgi:hypothetical protein